MYYVPCTKYGDHSLPVWSNTVLLEFLEPFPKGRNDNEYVLWKDSLRKHNHPRYQGRNFQDSHRAPGHWVHQFRVQMEDK